MAHTKRLLSVFCLWAAGFGFADAENSSSNRDSASNLETKTSNSHRYIPSTSGDETTKMLELGQSMADMGQTMAITGLLTSVICTYGLINTAGGEGDGLLSGNVLVPALLVGLTSYFIGIPLLGVGAGKINHAAEQINSNYHPKYKGWGWYGSGIAMIATGLIVSADTWDGFGHPAMFMIPAGFVCVNVAWAKFTGLSKKGRKIGGLAQNFELVPGLGINRDGAPEPSLALVYRL